MPHDTPLIATITVGLALAFIMALIANRLKLPLIVGYLAAGIMVGPFTPGFVADQKLAVELAEIGVILLMFGVGLHFSLKDLLSVRAIAIPGAIGQITVATVMGAGLSAMLGWSLGAGLIFGLALSVASTVVLLRALHEQRLIETERGRIAVGWLIVEDLVMVLTLVLIPPLAGMLGGIPQGENPVNFGDILGMGAVWTTVLQTAFKVGAFVLVMLVIGRRVIPWILHYVAHSGSRELFRLSVLSIALGVAYGSSQLFGVSFALGAFFAGMVMAESQLSTQAAKEILPLRDAFAVLFFVSVGMLFNPVVLVDEPLAVLATFLIIVVGKSLAAYLIVRASGYPDKVALMISASLAQIGEFSFILIVLGVKLSIVPTMATDLIVAGAILSILVNPLLFFALNKLANRPKSIGAAKASAEEDDIKNVSIQGHAVVVGYGSIGAEVCFRLAAKDIPLVVVEADAELLENLPAGGVLAFSGACGEKFMLEQLNLNHAHWLISTISNPFEAGYLIEVAKAANPDIRIIALANSKASREHLYKVGANTVLFDGDNIAQTIANTVLEDDSPAAAS